MKPKENKGYNTGTYDECQTPPYALKPLIQYIDRSKYIAWDCAAGERTLIRELQKLGIAAIGTDIKQGWDRDFFHLGCMPKLKNLETLIITNPPYSIKYEWLERCYLLGFPFALLMPVEMLGTHLLRKSFAITIISEKW